MKYLQRKLKAKRPIIYLAMLIILGLAAHHGLDSSSSTINEPTGSRWVGQLKSITDGDTIKVSYQGQELKIRLYGIDAPEKKQAFGQKSKSHLASLINGAVTVEPMNKDRYGRTVAIIIDSQGRNINGLMVANGLAWVYPQFCKKPVCSEWSALEATAHQNKTGLWIDREATPPWEWRKSK